MKRSYLIVAAVVVLAAAVYFFYQRTRDDLVIVDLVSQFANPTVEKRSSISLDLAYKTEPTTIAGETRPAIYMHPTSRLTYKRVTIPEGASLRVFLGVKEEAWDKNSDGVLFRFGIGDGRDYEEVLNLHVDPANNAGDRKWVEQRLDLSAYAGQQVDLIFNTNSSVSGRGDNPGYDFAVWGAPALVVKQ